MPYHGGNIGFQSPPPPVFVLHRCREGDLFDVFAKAVSMAQLYRLSYVMSK